MLDLFKNKEKARIVMGIMAACLFGQATNSISLMLSGISAEFPTASVILVQTVYSAAFYANPIAGLFGGVIAKYFRKKQILIVSHVLALGAAMLVFVLPHSIPMLIAVALLVGVGAGFSGVSYNGLMAEYFDAGERSAVFGLSSVFISAGGAVMSTLCGYLGGIRWDYIWLYFLILIPIIVLEFFLLPKGEKEMDEAEEGEEKPSLFQQIAGMFTPATGVIFLTAFLFGLVCSCFAYNISYMCDPVTSGLAYTVYMIASAVAGLTIGTLEKILKKYTVGVVLFVYAAALCIPVFSTGTAAVFICGALIGLAGGVFAPLVMAGLSNVVKPSQATLSLGLFQALAMVGTILYPYVITGIALRISDKIGMRFVLCAVVVSVAGIINLIRNAKSPAV